ncbi:MAG: Flp pilus assembly complex ATPase component TadA [Thermoguttaceae bacterium]|nr:Flp pilus assembly complex ATPase component TadA [Thermoguttaceae bacterium]
MLVFFEPEAKPLKLNAVQLRIARTSYEEEGRLQQPILNQLGARTEEIALKAIAQKLGLPVVDLTKSTLPDDVLVDFPTKIVHRRNVFPLGVQKDGALYVATSNPFDLSVVDEVSVATGLPTVPVVALPNELAKLIKSRLGVGAETIDGLIEQKSDVEILEDVDWDQGDAQDAQEASVVKLVNDILTEAVESGTSDVHIEAQETGMRIRYRIDGVLQTQPTPPEINRFQSAIVSRIKIMSRLNIAEKRIPQDGRIKLKVQDREVDLRVSIIPMLHGEGIVMRILDKDRMNFTLRGIGMDEDVYRLFGKLIALPHGIILLTGPTGSAKTTTLYSALNEIKSDETKIITTEDPIEYQLDGINQIQVHTKVGLTFAASLRAILRHDPDVVLVGEIRDFETAENAIQAAMTGHLVFSTLHTNDAAGAYTRMIDMGVEPFLVGTTVEGIMAQRLARRLCKHCKQPWKPKPEELPHDFPKELLETGTIYRPVGCRECRDTGYAGRVALYELLIPNDDIRRLAGEKAPSIEVKKVARANGMATLRDNGWKKVGLGITSVEEVVRVAKED